MSVTTYSTQAISKLADDLWDRMLTSGIPYPNTLVGIPRGGLIFAYAMQGMAPHGRPTPRVASVTETYKHYPEPWLLVDDIIATGTTVLKFLRDRGKFCGVAASCGRQPMIDTLAITLSGICPVIVGEELASTDEWIEFPWEFGEYSGPEEAVVRLLEYMGEDLQREGIQQTPARVIRFIDEWKEAAHADITVTRFVVESDDMVIVRNIPVYSLCEHHMLPYYGTCTVAYLPTGKVIGLSKIPRIVRKLASRLTVQERLTQEIQESVAEAADAPDVAVTMSAVHTCMLIRGPRAFGSDTLTSSLSGQFRSDATLRAEFLKLAEAKT